MDPKFLRNQVRTECQCDVWNAKKSALWELDVRARKDMDQLVVPMIFGYRHQDLTC